MPRSRRSSKREQRDVVGSLMTSAKSFSNCSTNRLALASIEAAGSTREPDCWLAPSAAMLQVRAIAPNALIVPVEHVDGLRLLLACIKPFRVLHICSEGVRTANNESTVPSLLRTDKRAADVVREG